MQVSFELPRMDAEAAARCLADVFGIRGTLRPLAGERDLNFHVQADDGRELVLKIAQAGEERSVLEMQHAAMTWLARQAPAVSVPQPVPSRGGESIVSCNVGDGAAHLVRVLTWIPGTTLATTRPHSPELLQSLGEGLGALTTGLLGFTHQAARRTLKWDLTSASWARGVLDRVASPERRALVDGVLATYEREVLPALSRTRRGVIYGDANDYNVLTRPVDAAGVSVAAGGPGDVHWRQRVTGFIDFGDMAESHVVCDLAIALAYAMLDKPDPVSAAECIVRGYHARAPLQDDEIALLLPLARTRLAVTVANAAEQAATMPGHEYLQISAEPAWALLERLRGVNDGYAECRFRAACGLEPSRSSPAVRAWLAAHRHELADVVEVPLDGAVVPVFDLSVTSGELGARDEWQDAAKFTRRLFGRMRDAGAAAAIGRYDEVRALYTSDVFGVETNDGPDFRAVHIGLDVFMDAGAPVVAPLSGRVHSFRDNANALDYGPTIILEHRVDGGALVFHTLYGHLTRESLGGLAVGQEIAAGSKVGAIGSMDENGGWPPHLHFQIITDLLGRQGDFPGVARAAEREVWLSLSPDPALMLRLAEGARAPRPVDDTTLLERRRRHIGPSLSIAYRRPLQIVRGVGQFLIDAGGRRYLDAVNNVAHVGHAHPHVVRAAARQTEVLNTNTRYLHEHLVEFAERLAGTLPPPLEVCYFVCSGSEANELALRLARTHTVERDLIVLDAGYHGNTAALIEASSYKFDGPGGSGAPPHVHKVPMPDVYRGPFAETDPDAGVKYAQAVREAVASIRRSGRRPAAFLAESILSCGGQIVLPPRYLAEAYRHIRDAGGVCIADEVQVGLGRAGSHFWAFESQGVVPDIVTMGKPLGNGHPLAAVVTTREIASSFANGMEYFNTFGGNTVSCAVGLAVLEVVESEGLQQRAARVGGYLMERLRDLAERAPLIGDVRGLGLFIGVELVTDRERKTPAATQAAYVANRMKDGGVLMSTDGPLNNVLKIKPPLCFGEGDADLLVATMARVLREL